MGDEIIISEEEATEFWQSTIPAREQINDLINTVTGGEEKLDLSTITSKYSSARTFDRLAKFVQGDSKRFERLITGIGSRISVPEAEGANQKEKLANGLVAILIALVKEQSHWYSGVPRSLPGLVLAISPQFKSESFRMMAGIPTPDPYEKFRSDYKSIQGLACLHHKGIAWPAVAKAAELSHRALVNDFALEGCSVVCVNSFYLASRSFRVSIWKVITPLGEAIYHSTGKPHARDSRRLELVINTHLATRQFTVAQEEKARAKLKNLVNEEQWRSYVVEDAIMETSNRSGVEYMIRKLRPTIAFAIHKRANGEEWARAICSLCLHPVGYYDSSFAGSLPPTDDVISHLLWIRGDEHGFWGKANHHSFAEMETGF